MPDRRFSESSQRDTQIVVPRIPDLDPAAWVRALRDVLDLSQDELGEKVGAEGGRDTVSKWEKKKGATEPGFTYTRRLVIVAPPTLQAAFLGRSAESARLSDPDRMVAADHISGDKYMTHEREAAIVAEEIDSITDGALRRRAMTEAMNAIAKVRENPSELVGDKKRHPAQHK